MSGKEQRRPVVGPGYYNQVVHRLALAVQHLTSPDGGRSRSAVYFRFCKRRYVLHFLSPADGASVREEVPV